MTTRRGFLSLLCAAPFAAPAIAKAAAAEQYGRVIGRLSVGSITIADYTPAAVSSFNFDRDVSWGIKSISPVDLVIMADVTPAPCCIVDDPHDPVPDYFC